MEKDYSKLRPFDLEAAKRGEPFVFIECGEMKPRKLIAGPDKNGAIVIQDEYGSFDISYSKPYSMAPLAWVEGKPVYNGDVLYSLGFKELVTISGTYSPGYLSIEHSSECANVKLDNITWNQPKVKREGWVNVSKKSPNSAWVAEVNGLLSHSYASKQDADKYALPDRIACVRIEWDE